MPWHWGTNAHGVAAHGSGVCCASPRQHLRAGVAAHSGGAAGRCYPYVDSRFSLKQRPHLLSGGMASAQGFLSTRSLEPTAIPEEVDRVVLPSPAPEIHLSVARCCCRQDPRHLAWGPLALAPRTSQRTTALLHASHRSICCARVSGFHRQRRRQGEGASSIQSQRMCLMLPRHVTALRQGGVPRAPEVMLDDAVQAHPGRLRLRRRTRCIACSRRLLLRKE